MATRAPYEPAVTGTDDVLATVLAAAQRAPLVPLTADERALLAEVEGKPVRWISHQDFAAALDRSDDRK